MNKQLKIFLICIVSFLFIIVAVYGIGAMTLEGENPYTVGVSLWYYNNGNMNVLRVASENAVEGRYLTSLYDKEETLVGYIHRLPGVERGVWEYKRNEENQSITFLDINPVNNEILQQVEINYEIFKEDYILFTYNVVEH